MAFATKEPTEVILGDTIQWRREDLIDLYPAPTWTLTYYFNSRNPAKIFTVVATNSSGFFLCDLSAVSGVQASWTRTGESGYEWVARVSNGSTKYTVGSGFMSIGPDIASLTGGTDRRSWAVRMRDAIRDVIEGRAGADVNSYMIGTKQIVKMTPKELQDWYAWIVQLADAELAEISPGLKKSGIILGRFR